MFRRLLDLAGPIAVQGLATASFPLVDAAMVASVHPYAVAALGIANTIYFTIVAMFIAVATASMIFMSQANGARDDAAIFNPFVSGLIINGVIGAVATLLVGLFTINLLRLYTDDAILIDIASEYFSIALYAIPLTAVGVVISFYLRSIGEPNRATKGFLFELPINIFLNAILIYGLLGFSAFGIEGAAIATVISRLFRTTYLISVGISSLKGLNTIGKTRPKYKIERSYFAIVAPLLGTTLVMSLSGNIYQGIFARLPVDEYSAYALFAPWVALIFVLSNSIISAASIILGQALGGGRYTEAASLSKNLLCVAILAGLGASLLLVPVYLFLPLIYGSATESTLSFSSKLVPLLSVLLFLHTLNGMFSAGVLQSGGDTRYPFFITVAAQFLISLPLGYVMLVTSRLDALFVFMVLIVEELSKLPFLFWRYKSHKWIEKL